MIAYDFAISAQKVSQLGANSWKVQIIIPCPKLDRCGCRLLFLSI